jgi:hypothetical protein
LLREMNLPYLWAVVAVLGGGLTQIGGLCSKCSAKREMGHARPFSIHLAVKKGKEEDDPKEG